MSVQALNDRPNIDHWQQRADLAAAFRWTERLNMHEAVANHFSLAVNEDGSQFLMNPNQMHFARVRASDMLLIDANDPETLSGPNAPDPTAWGLHGALHRNVPHARCAMHVHSIHATVLASLADSRLLPIDQNSAMFFDRVVIDENYGGLALEEEGERREASAQADSLPIHHDLLLHELRHPVGTCAQRAAIHYMLRSDRQHRGSLHAHLVLRRSRCHPGHDAQCWAQAAQE